MKTTSNKTTEKVRFEDLKVRIPRSSGCKLRRLKNLMYCTANGAYTSLFFRDGSSEITSHNLKYHEAQLSEYGFHRISRANLVNLRFISFISREKHVAAYLTSGALLRVSADRQAGLMGRLKNWLV